MERPARGMELITGIVTSLLRKYNRAGRRPSNPVKYSLRRLTERATAVWHADRSYTSTSTGLSTRFRPASFAWYNAASAEAITSTWLLP